MNSKRTTLIVGAGASNEVGLPVGNKLKKVIAKLFDIRYDDWSTSLERGSPGSTKINVEINAAFLIIARRDNIQNINPFLDACCKISDAMPQAISIDNFLNAHAGDDKLELAGKLGIAKVILDAEKDSKLFPERNRNADRCMINFENIQDTWFNKFFQWLTENCRVDDIPDRLSRVSVVSFNYDRCIAHFLHCALQNYFGINEEESADLLQNFKIFHPYGKVGSLPWQREEDHSIEFGASPTDEELINMSSLIRTFTEGTDPEQSEIIALRDSLVNADNLIFLGFAYHKINMDLLSTRQHKRAPATAYGTAMGISDPDSKIVQNEVRELFEQTINDVSVRNDLTCSQLFDEYRRTIAIT